MENIAYYLGLAELYRPGLLVAAAILMSVFCTVILWGFTRNKISEVLPTIGICLVLGSFCSRLVYWYCCYEQYDGFFDALFDFGHGGYSIFGAITGVFLGALLARGLKLVGNLTVLLDCIAPAGALGICIGRLSGFFTADDKGKTLAEGISSKQGFPLTVAVTNDVVGTTEWRFPTFFYESLAAFAIFIFSILIFGSVYIKGTRKKGTVVLMFMSLFGATQTVLESTRYDSLFMRSNGFLSIMQIASAVMLVAPVIAFGIAGIKSRRPHRSPLLLWIVSAALVGVAGYLEYYVQRHSSSGAVIYPIMLACLMVISLATFLYASRVLYIYRYSDSDWEKE